MTQLNPVEFDDIQVMTTEGIPFSLEIGGIGSRIIAAAIDGFLKLGLLIPLYFLYFLGQDTISMEIWGEAVGITWIFGVLWSYNPLFEWLWHGQTPGKRCMKLRVVHDDGSPIAFGAAILRAVMMYIDALFSIGLFVALFNRKTKRLGDIVAGTIVIKERQPKLAVDVGKIDPLLYSLPQHQVVIVRANRGNLTADELELLRKLPIRLGQMKHKAREALVQQLVSHFAAKLNVVPEIDGETFLNEVLSICGERPTDGS